MNESKVLLVTLVKNKSYHNLASNLINKSSVSIALEYENNHDDR